MCCLDISKAFDKVNHHGLFLKLMQRNTPKSFIAILLSWYSKCYCYIKWGNAISGSFKVSAGVRQGSVLSPALFAVYVNGILTALDNCGCKLFGFNFGSFMYADDLILIASSVTSLQKMIDICCKELEKIDMLINENKSVCIRIGKRCFSSCSPMRTSTGTIDWSTKVTYLGVDILAGRKFNCCYDRLK